MTRHQPTVRPDLIDQIVGKNVRKFGKAAARKTEPFVRAFYAHVPPDDISGTDPADLLAAALALRSFAGKRSPGQAIIRAYNPGLEEDGWRSPHTVIEIVNDDMPFLVDSIAAELNRRDISVHLLIHPIFRVRRGTTGTLLDIEASGGAGSGGGGTAESLMHIEIDEVSASAVLGDIESGLLGVLGDVRHAVNDWQAIRGRLDEALGSLNDNAGHIDTKDAEEAHAFLRWLDDDHFTFLGYREYEVIGEKTERHMGVAEGSGLGVLKDPQTHVFEGIRRLADLPKQVRAFLERKQLLIVNKANMRSTVHRSVHLDAIGIKQFDANGEVARERLFVGLFTSTVYSRSPLNIPILRTKIERTIARAGFRPASHDGKALLHILENLPRDELFQITEQDLLEIGLGILHLQERQRTALFVRKDSFERFISCLVYVPRDRHDTKLRKDLGVILEAAFNGPITAFYTQISEDSVLARIHFIVKTSPGEIPAYDTAAIEALLVEASRSWSDRLREVLVEDRGENKGLQLLRRYTDAFPTVYLDHFNAARALGDITRIEEARRSGVLALNLYHPDGAAGGQVRFKIYHRNSAVPLSDVLPMLENMGLKVLDEVPYLIEPSDAAKVWIDDFGVERRDGNAISLSAVRQPFEEAFARVWSGEMQSDGFNRLVIEAGLPWRKIVVLRTLAKYLRQAAIPFSQSYMEETLSANPKITQLIVDLFERRFDPKTADQAASSRIAGRIEKALDTVESLDQDRIIRRFVNLVEAATRTNYYQPADDGEPKSYLSIKFDSARIDELPLPRPMAEIFVYSPRMEGVHLRGGPVARGGLRWSDRREDFRTEILGLMKAQMVKNAVIVPVGSKGGFVVKNPPSEGGRDAALAEGIACYKILLRGMLDLTDNRVGDKIVPPNDVVRHDGDDPYLVVAADKGTATFSDIANGVSGEYGFWLDDAFASGGSAGYDHKKMGITARGGWEAVKRHFRETGKDIQSQDFTVIGVGDMSGDVFGNGMLLSRHIRLLAAFNHLHIFVDPDPDAAVSYAERKRLFELPRSSWNDYDEKLISKGGAVFERSAKSVRVSKQMKALFEIKRDKITPNELIRSILSARVELLWFGGIGTYVKARGETHAEVGDRATDALRIDAAALGAEVIGEGANLGVTHFGRIEFARAGGRVNSDAIDNSAGVDCSDHEVNIKILLGQVIAEGGMSEKQRNQLLVKMTGEVAALVLRDNYLQTQAISQIEALAPAYLNSQADFMRSLEREGRLDRALEFLPDEEEIAERVANRQGLVRPEISVLLAYAKIVLYDRLLDSELPDDPILQGDLLRYFPVPLQKGYLPAIETHRLRREIIATYVTNSVVNRVGPTFIHELSEKSGLGEIDVTHAYLIARDAFAMRDVWAAIEALDNKIPAATQTAMHLEARQLIGQATLWFLRNLSSPIDMRRAIETYKPGIAALSGSLHKLVAGADAKAIASTAAALQENGAPKALARKVAAFDVLAAAPDIVSLASGRIEEIEAVGKLYFALGARFGMDWLRAAAEGLKAGGYWQDLAATAMSENLYSHQFQLTQNILDAAGGEAAIAQGVIEVWIEARKPSIDRLNRLLDEIRGSDSIDISMLAVANRQLRALVSS
ncbi:MAG: NAD-glutamate dehydrogenase [Alphaproteobacteria bacterium]